MEEGCEAFWPSAVPCSGNGECNSGHCLCSGRWSSSGDFREQGLDCDIHLDVVRGLYAVLVVVWFTMGLKLVFVILPNFFKGLRTNGWGKNDRNKFRIFASNLCCSACFAASGTARVFYPERQTLGGGAFFTICFSSGMASFWCICVVNVTVVFLELYHKHEKHSIYTTTTKNGRKIMSHSRKRKILVTSGLLQNIVVTIPLLVVPQYASELVFLHYFFACISLATFYFGIIRPAITLSMERSQGLARLLNSGSAGDTSDTLQLILKKFDKRRKMEAVFLREVFNQVALGGAACVLVAIWPFLRLKVTYLLPIAWIGGGIASHLCAYLFFQKSVVEDDKDNKNKRVIELSQADKERTQSYIYSYAMVILLEIFIQCLNVVNFFDYAITTTESSSVYSLLYSCATLSSLLVGLYVISKFVSDIAAFRHAIQNGMLVQASRFRKVNSERRDGVENLLQENQIELLKCEMIKAQTHVFSALGEDLIILGLTLARRFWTDTVFTRSFVECLRSAALPTSCMQAPQRLALLQLLTSTASFTYNLSFSRDILGLKQRLDRAQRSLDKEVKRQECDLDLFVHVNQDEVEEAVLVRKNVSQSIAVPHAGINTNLQVLRVLRKEHGRWLVAAQKIQNWMREREQHNYKEIRRQILLSDVSFYELLETKSVMNALELFGWSKELALAVEENCVVLFGKLGSYLHAKSYLEDESMLFAIAQCTSEWVLLVLDGLSKRDRRVYDLVFYWENGPELGNDPAGLQLSKACIELFRNVWLCLPFQLYHTGPAADEAIVLFGGKIWPGDPTNLMMALSAQSSSHLGNSMSEIVGHLSSELLLEPDIEQWQADHVIEVKMCLAECLERTKAATHFKGASIERMLEAHRDKLSVALQSAYVVFMDAHSRDAADHACKIQTEILITMLLARLKRPIFSLKQLLDMARPHFTDTSVLESLRRYDFNVHKASAFSVELLRKGLLENHTDLFKLDAKQPGGRRFSELDIISIGNLKKNFQSGGGKNSTLFSSMAIKAWKSKLKYNSVVPSSPG